MVEEGSALGGKRVRIMLGQHIGETSVHSGKGVGITLVLRQGNVGTWWKRGLALRWSYVGRWWDRG